MPEQKKVIIPRYAGPPFNEEYASGLVGNTETFTEGNESWTVTIIESELIDRNTVEILVETSDRVTHVPEESLIIRDAPDDAPDEKVVYIESVFSLSEQREVL